MDQRDRAGEIHPHSLGLIFDVDVIVGTGRFLMLLAAYLVVFGGPFWALGSFG
ncbi:hypothetical protein [Aureimonas fodinaquatilis]|uniref:hypothetical protein n=1 Tax=Aureimonas fodinaquatilis TaxID=2565783 RepID=UPI00165E042C|nr:hypothetical protein [Aureimonas fodinaquatilis]